MRLDTFFKTDFSIHVLEDECSMCFRSSINLYVDTDGGVTLMFFFYDLFLYNFFSLDGYQ